MGLFPAGDVFMWYYSKSYLMQKFASSMKEAYARKVKKQAQNQMFHS